MKKLTLSGMIVSLAAVALLFGGCAGSYQARSVDVKNSPEIQNNKFAKVFGAQAPYGKIEPLIPEWPKIGDALITGVQEAFSGTKTTEQALKDVHTAANRALGVQ